MSLNQSNRVLLVDDEPRVLSSMLRLLDQEFEVTVASDGVEALSVYERLGPFPVVVADFLMPNMDGAVLSLELGRRDPSTRTIILSGNSWAEPIDYAVGAGAVFRVLQKPCGAAELIDHVRDAARA